MATINYVFGLLVILLLFGNLAIRTRTKKKLQFLSNSIILAAMYIVIIYMLALQTMGLGSNYILANLVSIDPFSLFFMLLLTFGIFLVNIVAYTYSTDYQSFAVLSSFALVGMYMVSCSISLLTIFIGLELVSIPAVFIILLSKRGLEAAVKLFIMASIAVAIFSFAMVLLYGNSNSILLKSYLQNGLLALASIFFIASLGFDASIFPFNILIPDVYQGSPAYVTAMLGGVNKKIGFVALMQIFILVFITFKSAFVIIAILSTLTMFYGNISAIMQKNFKRMLAYSSISQAGYILIGIATATQAGITASIFQIFAHVFLFIGLLSIVAWLELHNKNEVKDLTGLNNENSLAAFALTFFMISLVGLPFTTGFFGKFLLFLSAVSANLTWLAIIGIINSIISIYYYARPIILIYTRRSGTKHIKLDKTARIVVLICLAVTLIFGIYPQPIASLASSASAFLFR